MYDTHANRSDSKLPERPFGQINAAQNAPFSSPMSRRSTAQGSLVVGLLLIVLWQRLRRRWWWWRRLWLAVGRTSLSGVHACVNYLTCNLLNYLGSNRFPNCFLDPSRGPSTHSVGGRSFGIKRLSACQFALDSPSNQVCPQLTYNLGRNSKLCGISDWACDSPNHAPAYRSSNNFS